MVLRLHHPSFAKVLEFLPAAIKGFEGKICKASVQEGALALSLL
jgi:hypothetical protein